MSNLKSQRPINADIPRSKQGSFLEGCTVILGFSSFVLIPVVTIGYMIWFQLSGAAQELDKSFGRTVDFGEGVRWLLYEPGYGIVIAVVISVLSIPAGIAIGSVIVRVGSLLRMQLFSKTLYKDVNCPQCENTGTLLLIDKHKSNRDILQCGNCGSKILTARA